MLKHSYPSLASVITALGKTFSSGTTAQLFNVLDQGTSITFYSDNSHISDLPATNGILRLVKGPSTDNQRYALFHAVNGTLWYYKFHSDSTTNNGWNQVISNADLVSGYTESIDVQANSYTETTITHNMGVVPNIIVSLRALTGQIDRAGALTALIQEVTSNTATVRVFNSGTVQSGVNLYWIALRK